VGGELALGQVGWSNPTCDLLITCCATDQVFSTSV
jgi:hypothetical protein